jgi:hypothetical protein
MGSPISGLIAEIFLQHYENHIIKNILDNNTINFYNRYVDDIIIIYDSTYTNADEIPIILNNFKCFNQRGKQTLLYILTTEARMLHVFIVNIVHLILTLNVNQLL